MAVYVDNMRAQFGFMVMCHMVAVTLTDKGGRMLRALWQGDTRGEG